MRRVRHSCGIPGSVGVGGLGWGDTVVRVKLRGVGAAVVEGTGSGSGSVAAEGTGSGSGSVAVEGTGRGRWRSVGSATMDALGVTVIAAQSVAKDVNRCVCNVPSLSTRAEVEENAMIRDVKTVMTAVCVTVVNVNASPPPIPKLLSVHRAASLPPDPPLPPV
ncbi:hypothetical protein, conserved [Babesia bigemina]|uniref:Uncharacterized protein n=1 Tax=Babesia bigemina TaxID=5866 RepID=A0A061BJT7_BABBI|nr:hypothetical protein, conserved [Babesia bigemina]CDR71727.1 hypothetical protein, conserved [Babesia bigemina]|eukprot:XP_012770673.1 hypothetical protein, conserved [Babesia bigemina]